MRYIVLTLALFFGLGNAQASIADLFAQEDYAAALAQAAAQAAKGDADGHSWLGRMHEDGKGTGRDPETAAAHYRMAAALGDNFARWRLGVMIDQGDAAGTLADAVALFRVAAQDGYSNGLVSLAVMQATGRGTAKDYDAAFANYRRAAAMNNASGTAGVGVMLYLGQSRPVDKPEAAAWMLLAAAQGSNKGRTMLEEVLPQLTAQQRAGVQQRALELGEELGLPM